MYVNKNSWRMNPLVSPHFPLGTSKQPLTPPNSKRSITHLNFQIIAFPWFNKQQVIYFLFFMRYFSRSFIHFFVCFFTFRHHSILI